MKERDALRELTRNLRNEVGLERVDAGVGSWVRYKTSEEA